MATSKASLLSRQLLSSGILNSGFDTLPGELQPHIMEHQPQTLELQTHIYDNKGKLSPTKPGAWSELAKVLSKPEQLMSVCTWFPIEKFD